MIKLRKSLPEFIHEIDGCKFTLRPFSEIELEQFNHLNLDVFKKGLMAFSPESVSYCLKNCLIGWDGVCGEDGKEIPFKQGDEKYLPFKVRSSLVAEVFMGSIVTEDEKKS